MQAHTQLSTLTEIYRVIDTASTIAAKEKLIKVPNATTVIIIIVKLL